MTQALRAGRSPASVGNSILAMGTPAPVPVIRGREAEITILGETLDEVESGRRAVALIEGEPGIGKTRLLDAALEDRAAGAFRWPLAGLWSWSGPGPSA